MADRKQIHADRRSVGQPGEQGAEVDATMTRRSLASAREVFSLTPARATPYERLHVFERPDFHGYLATQFAGSQANRSKLLDGLILEYVERQRTGGQ